MQTKNGKEDCAFVQYPGCLIISDLSRTASEFKGTDKTEGMPGLVNTEDGNLYYTTSLGANLNLMRAAGTGTSSGS